MKLRKLLFGVALLAIGVSVTTAQNAQQQWQQQPLAAADKPIPQSLATANQLTAMLLQSDGGNQLISGIGVATLLQAIADGADGDSRQQIYQHLGDDLSLSDWQFGNDAVLQRANGVLITEKNVINRDYQAQLDAAGFIFANELKDLNDAVAAQTHGNIKEALSQLDPNTQMVLTDSLYFKDAWETPFKEEHTGPGDFHAACGGDISSQQVLMMGRDANVRLLTDDDAQVLGLALPFFHDYAMVVAMTTTEAPSPDGADAAAQWLFGNTRPTDEAADPKATAENDAAQANDNAHLYAVLGAATTEVDLKLPRIDVAAETNLIPRLQALGIVDIFDPDAAQLPNISATVPLSVQVMLQKATLKADEIGAEATAVTTVAMHLQTSAVFPPSYKPKIVIDRPFAFAIVQRTTGLVVMGGKVDHLNACD